MFSHLSGTKKEINKIVQRIVNGLKQGGACFLTFYGPNSGFKSRKDMTFYEYDQTLALLAKLPVEILDKTNTEGYSRNAKGEIIYQHSYRFILRRS